MVTMNIVRAGFKPAPTKNKKDIRKIAVQSIAATKRPLSFPLRKGGHWGCNETFQTCPHETRPRKNGEWGKEIFTE